MTRQEFIAVIAPIAVKLRKEGSPIFPSVRIAQAMLETGCAIHSWNNLVGLKVGSRPPNAYWKGRSVSTKTWEVYDGIRVDGVQANWRAYDTIEDCFRDQDILFQLSRYNRVRAAGSPQEQTAMLYACGYATDPAYAQKLNSFISGVDLTKYDKEAEEPVLPVSVADNIISSYLSPEWFRCDVEMKRAEEEGRTEDAVAWKRLRDHQNYLANELRKASGQAVE